MKTYQRYAQSLLLPLLLIPIIFVLAEFANFLDQNFNNSIAYFLIQLKELYLSYLPLLFAASVSFFFSRRMDGTNILSGILAYIIITNILSEKTLTLAFEPAAFTLDSSFLLIHNSFIGIMCGVISAILYNRFSTVQLPQGLAFFSGKRLVPIVTGFVMIATGMLFYLIWPPFVRMVHSFVNALLSLSIIGDGLFTAFYTLVTPIGLSSIMEMPDNLNSFIQSISMFIVPTTLAVVYFHINDKYRKEYTIIILFTLISSFVKGPTILFEVVLLLIHPLFLLIHILLLSLLVVICNGANFSIWMSGGIAALLYLSCMMLLITKKPQYFSFNMNRSNSLSLEETKQIFEAFGGIENIITIKDNGKKVEIYVVDKLYVDTSLITTLGYQTPKIKEANEYVWEVINSKVIADSLRELHQKELQALIL